MLLSFGNFYLSLWDNDFEIIKRFLFEENNLGSFRRIQSHCPTNVLPKKSVSELVLKMEIVGKINQNGEGA